MRPLILCLLAIPALAQVRTASWRIEWWDGAAWKPIEAAYPIEKDRFSRVTFSALRTNAIRVAVTTQGRRPAGILEWRVTK